MLETNTYKTDNIRNPWFWLKRVLFIGMFLLIMFMKFIPPGVISLETITLIFFLLVLAAQSDEIEINDNLFVISQNSLVPLLRSKRKYNLKDITSITMSDNTILGNSIFIHLFYQNSKKLNIVFNNKDSELVNSKLHKNKIKGLIEEITTREKSVLNKINFS